MAEPFDALSYSCGPPILSCSITINGTPGFRITQNLWNALQRVRKTDSDRRIWIDAVCIDQKDEREKSSQVRHMHAVYSRAEEVCIYWGECADYSWWRYDPLSAENYELKDLMDLHSVPSPRVKEESSPVFPVLTDGVDFWHDTDPEASRSRREGLAAGLINHGGPYYPHSQSTLEGCTPAILQLHVGDFLLELEEDFLGDPCHQLWWKRLWTVQELLLAKHPVVYCGPYVIIWNTVFQIWTEDHNIYRSHAVELLNFPRMRMDIAYLNALRSQSERNLHDLLLATTDKAFTEPKDRIFALLGASSKGTFSPDYALDTRVIYTSTAVHCIATQGTFDILFSRWERSYPLDSEVERLNSCVPDIDRSHGASAFTWQKSCLSRSEQGRWERARSRTLPGEFSFRQASPERAESMSVLSGRNATADLIENTASRCRIAFAGACVSTVSKLYKFGQDNLDWILTDLSRSTSQYFAESLCEGNRHWNVFTTDQQEQHAYDLYTLMLESCSLHLDGYAEVPVDLKFEAQRQRENHFPIRDILHAPEECVEFLALADECFRHSWNDCLTGPLASLRHDWTVNRQLDFPKHINDVHEVLQRLLLAVVKRKTWSGTFFITSDGHLGIGPESTQPGDQIVVLDGARSPFVLRNLEDSTDYALLGDSFVLGLMHGEVREMDARGQLESRQIVIR